MTFFGRKLRARWLGTLRMTFIAPRPTVGRAVRSRLGNWVRTRLGNWVRTRLGNCVRTRLGSCVRASVGRAVRVSAGAPSRVAVGSARGRILGRARSAARSEMLAIAVTARAASEAIVVPVARISRQTAARLRPPLKKAMTMAKMIWIARINRLSATMNFSSSICNPNLRTASAIPDRLSTPPPSACW